MFWYCCCLGAGGLIVHNFASEGGEGAGPVLTFSHGAHFVMFRVPRQNRTDHLSGWTEELHCKPPPPPLPPEGGYPRTHKYKAHNNMTIEPGIDASALSPRSGGTSPYPHGSKFH